MEGDLIMERKTLTIEGGRTLYAYTFRTATDQDRLTSMIEGREAGVIGPFLDRHPGLDVPRALELARRLGNEEAVREIESRS